MNSQFARMNPFMEAPRFIGAPGYASARRQPAIRAAASCLTLLGLLLAAGIPCGVVWIRMVVVEEAGFRVKDGENALNLSVARRVRVAGAQRMNKAAHCTVGNGARLHLCFLLVVVVVVRTAVLFGLSLVNS